MSHIIVESLQNLTNQHDQPEDMLINTRYNKVYRTVSEGTVLYPEPWQTKKQKTKKSKISIQRKEKTIKRINKHQNISLLESYSHKSNINTPVNMKQRTEIAQSHNNFSDINNHFNQALQFQFNINRGRKFSKMLRLRNNFQGVYHLQAKKDKKIVQKPPKTKHQLIKYSLKKQNKKSVQSKNTLSNQSISLCYFPEPKIRNSTLMTLNLLNKNPITNKFSQQLKKCPFKKRKRFLVNPKQSHIDKVQQVTNGKAILQISSSIFY